MKSVSILIAFLLVGSGYPDSGLDRDKAARLAPPKIEITESGRTGQLATVQASWRAPLEDEIRRLGTTFTVADLVMATTGGMEAASHTMQLPSLDNPIIEIVSSDFESVSLSDLSASTQEQLSELLARRPAKVVGIGLTRREPVGTLDVRMLTYDPDAQTLRRYRSLAVRTSHPPLSLGTAAKRQSGGSKHLLVTRSVLADGTWFKLPVSETGIYRIDAAYIASLGLSPQGIDPARIRVFGNGGAPLPALNGDDRPVDLIEQPMIVSHDNDTAFESGEYALFYGTATRGWTYDETEGDWTHYVNPFSNENYYFIQVGGPPGLRLEPAGFPDYPNASVLNQFEARLLVEDELIHLEQDGSGSGLEWFGAFVDSEVPRRNVLSVEPDGLLAGTVRYRTRVAVRSNPSSIIEFESEGTTIGSATVGSIDLGSQLGLIARPVRFSFSQTVAAASRISVDMRLVGSINEPQAWLDWLEVFYPRSLEANSGMLEFHTPVGEEGAFEFRLQGFATQPIVWDVTEHGEISMLAVRQDGADWVAQTEVQTGETPRELVAFVSTSPLMKAPGPGEPVANQDLHGITDFPDFVIVTAADMLPVAQELAARRRAEGLAVQVTDIEHIQNEFSGGVPDMRALRDYLKFLYDRGLNEGRPLRYALLMGDGHFDFRNITQDDDSPLNRNVIFPYQTDNTLTKGSSYTSDDYFGLLDDSEGIWAWTGDSRPSSERVDIGIGRWPVSSAEEARDVLEKIKRYESNESQGAWRTRYTFVADDGPAGSSDDKDLHTQNADFVAEALVEQFPEVNTTKIYAISYPSITTSNGRRVPDAKRDIRTALDDGTLVWNYSGHGGISGLADERIFTLEDVDALQNGDRMSVFITATCTFGRFDTEREQSGAELLLLREEGGSVALFTTVRIVVTWSNPNTFNLALNLELNKHLMQRDEQGRGLRLGDVLRVTKNTNAGLQGNNRKFNLLGDPTMRLGLPTRRVSVTEVNGEAVTDTTSFALRALDRIAMAGEVSLSSGPDQTFDGTVDVTVFDAKRTVTIDESDRRHIPSGTYTVQNNLIYRGRVPVTDGQFDVNFVVPKDISFSDLPGRVSMYASADVGDGFGATEKVSVGGTADNPVIDVEGPVVELFLNDTTFVSGGLTPPAPLLIVRFKDDTGINTVGTGVGHEMLLVIDEDEQNAIELGDRFEAELGSSQSGSLTYRLPEQAIGDHSLRVKAWDVANNSTTSNLDYLVASTESLQLQNVFNYPNPMAQSTRFVFEHNQPAGTPAEVELRLYTISGRLINVMGADETLPSGVLPGGPVQIPWNGRDADLDGVSPGVYLYQLKVTVDLPGGGEDSVEHLGRLAVLG